jgi:predicted transposase YbfD/YdcC
MSDQTTTRPRILDYFGACEDPRTRPVQYPLLEIIITVVLATLCGEEGWEAIVEWAEDKLAFLKKLLPFNNGIPCPDTIRRVIERINPEQFLDAFVNWAQELKARTAGQVCIDGKVLRGAIDEHGPLHIVSAWSEANRIVLAATKTRSKSNEITAINDLLNLFILKEGDVVSIDAIGCQKSIVSKIIEQKADYVIALKQNQLNLSAEVGNFFDQATAAAEYAPCVGCCTWQKQHGRTEKLEVWVTHDVDWIPQRHEWEGLASLIMIMRRWEEGGVSYAERRYYISSLRDSPQYLSRLIRRHWSVENELHWQLDVSFREDDSQIGPEANENLRVARMTSLELLRAEKTFKMGIKAKIRKCVRSDDYLLRVLGVETF